MKFTDKIYDEIANTVLGKILPPLIFLGLIANIVLIFTLELNIKNQIPGYLMLALASISWFFYKNSKIKISVFIFALLLYLSIILGMLLNGGLYATIFSAQIAFIGVIAILFRKRVAIIIFIGTILINIVFLHLHNIGFIKEVKSLPPYIILILNSVYQILLLLITFFSTSMIHKNLYERNKKEEELTESKKYISSILNSIGDSLITIDYNQIIKNINRSAIKLFGITGDNIIGVHMLDVLDLENIDKDLINKPIESTLKIDNQPVKNIVITYYLLDEKNKQKSDIVVVIKDVTDELKLRDQLSHSQKMESVGQLSSGIAHDFNNMLGGIIGAVEILEDTIVDEDDKELLDIISNSAERASGLTKQLLNFSRKGKYTSKKIDISEVIDETVALLGRTIDRSIKISKINLNNTGLVLGDISQIQSCFVNIGINASHAMPNGGILTFKTDLGEREIFSLPSSCKAGNYIRVTITDSGTGISKENIDKIFDPFFTTKAQGKGTGLGLSAVYGVMQSHGGFVSVESIIGEGTKFFLYFPIVEFEESNKEKKTDKIYFGNGEKILIVDDEPTMLLTSKLVLSRLKYSVTTATNGEEAIKHYKSQKFDIIFSDMIMPIMSGKELFYEIKELNRDIKFIIVSGFSKCDDVETMLNDGLTGFIRKPYRQSEVSQVVYNALHLTT